MKPIASMSAGRTEAVEQAMWVHHDRATPVDLVFRRASGANARESQASVKSVTRSQVAQSPQNRCALVLASLQNIIPIL